MFMHHESMGESIVKIHGFLCVRKDKGIFMRTLWLRHIYENSLVKDHSEQIVREANRFLRLKGTTRGTPCSNSFDFSQWNQLNTYM